jgi:transposase
MDGVEGNMTAIGVDTHKATLAACAVDPLGAPIAEATFANNLKGHLAFIAWARSNAPEATIGIEGSSSYGAPLARSLGPTGWPVRSRGPTAPEPG